VNLEEFKSKGVKLEAKLRLVRGLKLETGIARTGRLSVADGNALISFAYAYSTDISNALSLNSKRLGMTFSAYHKYNGKLPVYRFNAEGELEQTFISPYNMIDLSLTKRFWKDRVMLTAGVNNLVGHVRIEASSVDGSAHGGDGTGQLVGTGRTGFIKLTMDMTRIKPERTGK